LNVAALKKAEKVPIEIGTIESAGMNARLEAEVRKGLITKIRPVGCEKCGHLKSKGKRSTALKKVLGEGIERLRALGESGVKLPIPISQLSRETGTIGPVTITIEDGVICIEVTYPDGKTCLYCSDAPIGLCVGPIVVQ
jgi:hypothetical protein